MKEFLIVLSIIIFFLILSGIILPSIISTDKIPLIGIISSVCSLIMASAGILVCAISFIRK